MSTLLTIKKQHDELFYLVEYDPNRPDDELYQKIMSSYTKCGLILDAPSHTMLKVGNYETVFAKFKEMEQKYIDAGLYQFADDLRIYDISKMSAEDIDKILKNSGIAEVLLKKYPELPFVKGNSFDDYELIED